MRQGKSLEGVCVRDGLCVRVCERNVTILDHWRVCVCVRVTKCSVKGKQTWRWRAFLWVVRGPVQSSTRDTNFNQQTSINISGVSLHNTQGQRQGQNFSHFADFGFWSRLLYTSTSTFSSALSARLIARHAPSALSTAKSQGELFTHSEVRVHRNDVSGLCERSCE